LQAVPSLETPRCQVDASEAEREKAALEAAQRQAAVDSLQAQYQELLVAVSKANQKVVSMMKVKSRRLCQRRGRTALGRSQAVRQPQARGDSAHHTLSLVASLNPKPLNPGTPNPPLPRMLLRQRATLRLRARR
jgi:hypothetical protein